MKNRSWVEISLGKLKKNINMCQSIISNHQKIMAVVKADAYGHGDTKVAQFLQENGISDFAVSNLAEAVRLREAGIIGQILILGYTPKEYMVQIKKYGLTQTLLSEEYAEELSNTNIRIEAQFAVDTGMNRIGIDADDAVSCEKIIRCYAEKFNLTGMFTHLCVADNQDEDEFTRIQIDKFKAIVSRIEDLKLQNIHCMNSAGGLWHGQYGNLVRFGIVLYGLKPDYRNKLPQGMYPVLEWKTVIAMIKSVNPGESIGYGRSAVASKEMRIATLPTGYADGYNRLLSNKGYVLIHGKKAPIIGKICMDQMMVDITDIPEANYRDEVLLIGDGYTADEMAHSIGTIGYEVVCNISKRVPRIYIC